MNKADLVKDLESKVIKVLAEGTPGQLNGGGKEYSYTCRVEISPNVSVEETYCVAVYNEGLESESATYTGKQPPAKYTDLEIGLGLVAAKYPSFKFVPEKSTEKLFTIDVDGNLLTVTLNSKKELVEVPTK